MNESSPNEIENPRLRAAFAESELKALGLEFQGLALGEHRWDFSVGARFFELFPEQDFREPEFSVALVLNKQTSLFELSIEIAGSVEVDCDRSLRTFRMPVEAKRELVIRFADVGDLTDDELVFITPEEHRLETAQWVYETIASAVPIKRLHPEEAAKDEPGRWEFGQPTHTDEGGDPDPRWDKLKDLLNS